MASKDVMWFHEVGKEEASFVGGKGANLGEMLRAGIPVAPGFIVTADAYHPFNTAKVNIAAAVQQLVQSHLAGIMLSLNRKSPSPKRRRARNATPTHREGFPARSLDAPPNLGKGTVYAPNNRGTIYVNFPAEPPTGKRVSLWRFLRNRLREIKDIAVVIRLLMLL
ncbi:MAG: hypothetical protein HYX99_01070 [Chloroflexi bacterium]|nr:hypothetical protein [Chloroflexota bacterium]